MHVDAVYHMTILSASFSLVALVILNLFDSCLVSGMQNSGYSYHPYQKAYTDTRRQRYNSAATAGTFVEQSPRGYVESSLLPSVSTRYPSGMTILTDQESPVAFPIDLVSRSYEDSKLGSFNLPDVVPDDTYGSYWNRRGNATYNQQPGLSDVLCSSAMVSPETARYSEWRPHHQHVSNVEYNQYQTSPHASSNFHATFSY